MIIEMWVFENKEKQLLFKQISELLTQIKYILDNIINYYLYVYFFKR